jgi:hypothetical protein
VSAPEIEDATEAVAAQLRAAAAALECLRQAPLAMPARLHGELLDYVRGIRDLAGDIESFGAALAEVQGRQH